MDSLRCMCWRIGKSRKQSLLKNENLSHTAADFLYTHTLILLLLGDLMYPYINFLGLHIPSYGLCACAAVFLSAVFVFLKARKANINFYDLIIVIAVSIGCAMLGGIFLYIFVTYDFATLLKQIATRNPQFLKNPGIVFYGGLLGGIAGGIITSKILKIQIEIVEVCVVPYIPLGHAVGRMGCLLAGCCYGLPYNGIFAVSTTFDANGITHFPIQAVEALLNLLLMKILLLYTKKARKKYNVLSLYFIMYSFLRFCLEFFRNDSIRGKFLLFSTSQWISLMIFLIFFTVTQINLKRK